VPTFTYDFGGGTNLTIQTDALTSTLPGQTLPHGAGYPITSISGTYDGFTITGMVGPGGYQMGDTNPAHIPIDNIIFNGDANGFPNSTKGIDQNGLGFSIDYNGQTRFVNLYSNGDGTFISTTYNADGVADTPASDHIFVSVTTSENVPCYRSGTKILTASGEVPVEDLEVGDLVITASGARKPIRWLGHREIRCRDHAAPASVWPIRISAHAFAPGRPSRDLYVSPGHAICLDLLGEVLIPAFALVNGATIAQIAVETVTYWHIELDEHDILLAENQPAESYLESDNRAFFVENDIVSADSRPDAVDPSTLPRADFCRPRHDAGPLVVAFRAQLRARARELGWELDEKPPLDLHLLVDGSRVEPVIRGTSCRFAIPAGAQEVWLESSVARPSDVSDSDDRRELGACIKHLTLCDGFGADRAIDLGDPQLDLCGFHYLEDGVRRWTSGRARIPSAYFQDCRDGVFLRVELDGPLVPRWVAPVSDHGSVVSAA
jgi:hypothetical protein